eukprot:CAMPEP_0206299272 /NCGR_PEP_ID=MMETSP0106_2-20121207/7105_1 /ASSEMBLY_ACC=CAM_ASM_000206 /TAXON_ID=81532 /ORGANISM="Acanthoeca-like sp., Strain 10tr" /LENGTH=52 /DNA_ID=CAMNT_0053729969 /DNA_START=71 /DNA_END=226 /DNA_ORIENTATION=-
MPKIKSYFPPAPSHVPARANPVRAQGVGGGGVGHGWVWGVSSPFIWLCPAGS